MLDVIETDRLTLRRFTDDDLERLMELDGDPEVMHYITDGMPTSRDEMRTRILPHMKRPDPATGYGFWAAWERASATFLGWFHLVSRTDGDGNAPELGYRLRRAAWGRGYGTEGSRALIDLAFREMGVRRVVAETMAVHAASRRVMEKAGMRLIRTFHADWPVRIPGDELGDVEYAITRADWLAQGR